MYRMQQRDVTILKCEGKKEAVNWMERMENCTCEEGITMISVLHFSLCY
jgi:hypothetical protein